jgi:type IV pilus assembly protein PilC
MAGESKSSLQWQLEKEGNFVYRIQREGGVLSWPGRGEGFRVFNRREFYSFNQEFLVLLKTGTPIVAALDAIIEKAGKSGFFKIIEQVRYDVSTGSSLSDACAKHPRVFSKLYVASIKAGEKSGNISRAISRHVDYLKKIDALRKKVVTASTYPIILVTASAFVLLLLMTYVVPAFTQTYLETGSELPLLTRILIATATAFKTHFLSGLGLVVLAGAGFAYARTREPFVKALHRMKLRIPLLGPLFLNYATARFTRTVAVVLEGGAPLIESIRIAAGVISNRYLEDRLEDVALRLEEGGQFSSALEETRAFPPLASRMISTGESGGLLEPVLNEIADFYDSEVEGRLAIISSAVEPALMVLMGLLIGLIVVAMYLPIFQLAGTVF